MNKVFLIGNLTRDPELTTTPSGVSVCRFAIAVNRNYTSADGERQTDFFNITAWRGLGERVAQYQKKGSKVAITGSIQIRNYDDNQGVRRTAVDIIAEDVEFLSPKNTNEDGSQDSYSAPASSGKKKPVLQAFEDDSDIPF
ncbi:MAG: single-stranded DNA-binding protein [Clostridia bacterium]|nr:single-stranded DNA-binding protein [Clostridia bacterium]